MKRKSIFSKRQHDLKCKTVSSLFPSVCLDDQLMKNSRITKNKKKKKREIKTRGGRMDGIVAISLQLGNYIRFGAIIDFKTRSQLPLSLPLSLIPPLFKTFLVYPREIVLLTQFSPTRFSINRTGARVRNNSLPKWCSINKLPISFSISSNRSAVSIRRVKREIFSKFSEEFSRISQSILYIFEYDKFEKRKKEISPIFLVSF